MPVPTNKISLLFTVPLESSDSKVVRAAYKELASQVLRFAEAIKIDSNIMIVHTTVSEDLKDLKACTHTIVDPKLAELQTINKKVASGKSAVDNPNQPITELSKGFEDEPARVTSMPMSEWKEEKEAVSIPVVDVDKLKEKLLEQFQRLTTKTKAVIEFLANNHDKEVTSEEIATGAKLEAKEITSWLSQTGKTVKALENVKRGVYKLNSTKVKI
jgi:hypothetical protein